MEVISYPEEGKLNLLGLIIREIFLKKGKGIKVNRTFSVGIKAGKMASTLIFKEGVLEIRNGILEKTSCLIEGNLGRFLSLTSSNIPIIPIVKGELKIRGNPIVLLYFVRIMRKVLMEDEHR